MLLDSIYREAMALNTIKDMGQRELAAQGLFPEAQSSDTA